MIDCRIHTTQFNWITRLFSKHKREYLILLQIRNLANQDNRSGELNAKTRQLLELQLQAQQQFAAMQAQFASGLKTAQEVQRDLEWTQKKVT
jgi:hypothetical protein